MGASATTQQPAAVATSASTTEAAPSFQVDINFDAAVWEVTTNEAMVLIAGDAEVASFRTFLYASGFDEPRIEGFLRSDAITEVIFSDLNPGE